MDDDTERWIDDLESEIASTKWLQWREMLRDLDMQRVTCVDVDRCIDPLGELSNAAVTERHDDCIISIPWTSLFGEEDDDAC